MARLIGKLMVLLAVLLMPMGMAPAAAASPHQAIAANMPMEHCPDPAPGHETKGVFADCTMACAAALPAVDIAAQGPLLIVCEPPRPVAASRLHGLHPEMDPPPPKHS